MSTTINEIMKSKTRAVLNCYMYPSEALQVCNNFEEELNQLAQQYGIKNPVSNGYFLMEILLTKLGITKSNLREYNHKTAQKKLREDGTAIMGDETYLKNIQPVVSQPVEPNVVAPQPVVTQPVAPQVVTPTLSVPKLVMPVQANTVPVLQQELKTDKLIKKFPELKEYVAGWKNSNISEEKMVEMIEQSGRKL